MIKKRWFRLTLGVVLGGFAGLSLTTSILPMVVSTVLGIESFFVRWSLGGYAAHSTLVWAFAGWVAARTGLPRISPILFGLLGLASGFLLAYAGLGTEIKTLAICAVGAASYGVIGGLLLGSVLASPSEEISDSDHKVEVVSR